MEKMRCNDESLGFDFQSKYSSEIADLICTLCFRLESERTEAHYYCTIVNDLRKENEQLKAELEKLRSEPKGGDGE